MQTKPEFRRSQRFGHEYIIKLGEELTPTALTPYYAVSLNLSETGMHFKSLFELHPGALLSIIIDDYALSRNQIPAKVVWCKKLENTTTFRFAVGVEFLRPEKGPGIRASLPAAPPIKTPGKKEGGIVIQMSKRSVE
jgi:hypothetical protein